MKEDDLCMMQSKNTADGKKSRFRIHFNVGFTF